VPAVDRPAPARSTTVLLRVVVIAASVAVLAGCNGGTVDRHALTNDSATLDSIACEGALLADQVVDGKTTTNFTREQAEELAIQSANLADALARRPARKHCIGCSTTRPTAPSPRPSNGN
jgi:hypothetical protein